MPIQSTRTIYKTSDDALTHVRNIFCVGRNYRDHAVELGNPVPERPMIFAKTTHALVPAKGLVQLPADRANVHHELEIVLWIAKDHEPGQSFADSVGGIALGLDLTDRDAQSSLKAAGQPWEYAKGFLGSAVITDFHQVTDWHQLQDTAFSLYIDDRPVQTGEARDMLFSFQQLMDYIALHFGLRAGDIVYTGTPAGVGPLKAGNRLRFEFAGEVWAECQIG